MTDKNIHLLQNEISSQFVYLLYQKSIIDSYKSKPLRRDLFSKYKLAFKSFIKYLSLSQDNLLIISNVEAVLNNDIPNFKMFYQKNGGSYSRDEIGFQFLRQKSNSSLKNLNIKSAPSFQNLIDNYNDAILSVEKSVKQLNWDFLLIFKTYFGNINLSEIIELYIDILIDEKEFDGIETIEHFIFNKNYEPKDYFLDRSLFIFDKVLKCFRFTEKKAFIKSILDRMYKYMDENFDTYNNTILPPDSSSEYEWTYLDGDDKGVIQKKDREDYFNSFTESRPKLSFSNLTQLNNAYRLNLINQVAYNRNTIRLQKNKKLNDDLESKIKDFEFLILDSDIDIPEQINSDEYFHNPNTYDFYELNSSQKSEYKTAFADKGNVHKIKKYVNFRIDRINNAFYKNQITSEHTIAELQFLKQFQSSYNKDSVGDILAINALDENNLMDKINKCRNKIHETTASQNQGVCVKFNEEYYRFYITLEYIDAIKLPEEIIDIIIEGGNISEEEWWKWNKENKNIEVSFKASRLNDSIRYGEYKSLVSTKKTDAPILINLLEKEYKEFMIFFNENLSPKQYSHFIDPLISRLMSAYITINEYEKAICLSEEFIKIKNEYTELFFRSDAEDILIKREKCLRRISGDHDTVNRTSYNFLSFDEAKIFARTLRLKSENDWKEYKKSGARPNDIPALPERVYKGKGWTGFQDWLGYGTIKRNSNNFLSFEEAKEFVKELMLKNENEWRAYRKSGLKPENIPSLPEKVYKNDGWKGYSDWLR